MALQISSPSPLPRYASDWLLEGGKKRRPTMLREMARHRIPNSLLIGITAGLLCCIMAPDAKGQTCSPYSDFQSMSLSGLATLQVKLTYVGIQNKGIPSVGFTSSPSFNASLFVPFRRPNVSYSNDDA